MKKRYLIAAAALVGFCAAALAQTIAVPQVTSIGSADLFQDIVAGIPSARSQYASAAQITSQSGYVVVSPTTGFAYTFGNSQSFLILTNSATDTNGSVTLAPAPSDGDNACLYSQAAITNLTIAGNTGQTINNAVTTLAATTQVCYLYALSTNTWNRSK